MATENELKTNGSVIALVIGVLIGVPINFIAGFITFGIAAVLASSESSAAFSDVFMDSWWVLLIAFSGLLWLSGRKAVKDYSAKKTSNVSRSLQMSAQVNVPVT